MKIAGSSKDERLEGNQIQREELRSKNEQYGGVEKGTLTWSSWSCLGHLWDIQVKLSPGDLGVMSRERGKKGGKDLD